VTERKTKSAG